MRNKIAYCIIILIGFLFNTNLSATTKTNYPDAEFSVPSITEFKDTTECRSYNNDALKCAHWLLDTPANTQVEKREKAQQFLFMWLVSTPDIMVNVDRSLESISSNPFMLGAYFSSLIIYCLDNNIKSSTFTAHYQAILDAIEFYKKNKKYIVDDKTMDEYIQLQKENKLEPFIKRIYNSK